MRWDRSAKKDLVHTLFMMRARNTATVLKSTEYSVKFPVSAIENVTLALKCMAN